MEHGVYSHAWRSDQNIIKSLSVQVCFWCFGPLSLHFLSLLSYLRGSESITFALWLPEDSCHHERWAQQMILSLTNVKISISLPSLGCLSSLIIYIHHCIAFILILFFMFYLLFSVINGLIKVFFPLSFPTLLPLVYGTCVLFFWQRLI